MNFDTGSYFGKAGNALEKEVVKILNNKKYLDKYKTDSCTETLFNKILNQLCDENLSKVNIIKINATNDVEKLINGGNAKTDIIVKIYMHDKAEIVKTLSIKNTSQKIVSCHDYQYTDFVRVLDVGGTKLEEYFKLFQETPSYSGFKASLPLGYTIEEFEENLNPYTRKLTEWALTGAHDQQKIIDKSTQISKYLLIVKNEEVYCCDFKSYIEKLFYKSKLNYGIPLSWTYPSKRRGKRIQLKMPILIE